MCMLLLLLLLLLRWGRRRWRLHRLVQMRRIDVLGGSRRRQRAGAMCGRQGSWYVLCLLLLLLLLLLSVLSIRRWNRVVAGRHHGRDVGRRGTRGHCWRLHQMLLWLLLLLLIVRLGIDHRRSGFDMRWAGAVMRQSRRRSRRRRYRSLHMLLRRIRRRVQRRKVRGSLVNVRLRHTLLCLRRRRRRQRPVPRDSGRRDSVSKPHLGHGVSQCVGTKVRLRHLRVKRWVVRDGMRARHRVLLGWRLMLVDNVTWFDGGVHVIGGVSCVAAGEIMVALRRRQRVVRS